MYNNHFVQIKAFFMRSALIIISIFWGSTQICAQDTTWTFHTLPFQQGALFDVSFVDDASGWAVGFADNVRTSVIINTADSGAVWSLQNHPAQDALYGVYFMDADSGYAVGQASDGWVVVLKTTDGGLTWQAQNTPQVRGFLEDVTFVNHEIGWAIGYDVIANTSLILQTDNATDWTQVNHPAKDLILYNVFFIDENNGWIVGTDEFSGGAPAILHTNDGGDNWVAQNHGFDHGALLDVFFTSPDTGFVSGGVDSMAVILSTVDRGANWNPVSISGLSVGAMQFGKMALTSGTNIKRIVRIRVVGRYGLAVVNIVRNGMTKAILLISVDGGRNWFPWGAPVENGKIKGLTLTKELMGQVVGFNKDGSAFSAKFDLNSKKATKLKVNPSMVTLSVNDKQQFQATGYNVLGNEIPITPIWSATGGNINGQTGLYTATTAGDFNITASVSGSTVTGKATVHVTSGGQLVKIKITPKRVDLNPGRQQQFKATGYDRYGRPVPFNPIWSAKGGTVTQTGQYTAGSRPGAYLVICRAKGTSVKNYAWVRIRPVIITRIVVSPRSVVLNPGQKFQFKATAYRPNGQEIPFTPIWTTSGGTINKDGLYIARRGWGIYTVIARAKNTNVWGYTRVIVRNSSLNKSIVSSNKVQLKPGESLQFFTKNLDAQGNEIPFVPSWNASGGILTVINDSQLNAPLNDSASVLYTAKETGNHMIVMTDHAVGIVDTIHVDVKPVEVFSNDVLPDEFELLQNFPNPFNPETTITFHVKETSHVSLKVFDYLGREVAVLADSRFNPGKHEVTFDGQEFASGLFFYVIRMQDFYDVKKMVLLK